MLDLLKSFFAEEPDSERISRWRGIFAALGDNSIHPVLDDGIRELQSLLTSKNLEEIKQEYYTLFTDPYTNTPVELSASHYLDGKNFGPSLVRYRQFMKENGLIRKEGVTDPEDHLVLMLDALATLIEDERGEETQARNTVVLVEQFIKPTAEALEKRLQDIEQAQFYKSCTVFLNGYLDLEQGLLPFQYDNE